MEDPEENRDAVQFEIKYLGKGITVNSIVAILLFCATGVILLLPFLGTEKSPFPLGLLGLFLMCLMFALMIFLYGLVMWNIWPRYVRFYNEYVEIIEAGAGPISRKKPIIIKYDEIQSINQNYKRKELLIYSNQFKGTWAEHRDIDLNGLTEAQVAEIISRFTARKIKIQEDKRMSMAEVMAMMDKK